MAFDDVAAAVGGGVESAWSPATVAAAYALIPVATGLRWAAATWTGSFHGAGTLGAGALWLLAFVLYLLALWPIWTTPRPAKEVAP